MRRHGGALPAQVPPQDARNGPRRDFKTRFQMPVCRTLKEQEARAAHLTTPRHPRFKELQLKSLYLGLSDGARTNELRRASDGEIGNEQIWQAYELGEEKASDMGSELADNLKQSGFASSELRFNLVWLLDDFSGSGNTYIHCDSKQGRCKGKLKKSYERLHRGDLVDTTHYQVFLLLYVARRKARSPTGRNGLRPNRAISRFRCACCARSRTTRP